MVPAFYLLDYGEVTFGAQHNPVTGLFVSCLNAVPKNCANLSDE
jgi:hypothetical protein